MNQLSAKHFHDEDAAREFLENVRWANGVVCPHCGVIGEHYKVKSKSARKGLRMCKDCRKQFTVTVGTLFERSKIGLNQWLQCAFLMCSSKKGMSSHQIHRILGVTYKTAWFMCHRLREAMKDPVFVGLLGGSGIIVEADETYWGNTRRKGVKVREGYEQKEKIFALVERGGRVPSFHLQHVCGKTLKPILYSQVARETCVMTDEFGGYKGIGDHFVEHGQVKHSHKEYVRGKIHTNTIEGFFSIVKRGLIGTYHHVGSQHLKRYMGEFDFKYSNRKITDSERTVVALKGIAGKRLTYTATSKRIV
ncbi:MAG: IS1595 family transposase [Candidatus Zixiibacteriota bacterium]